MKNFSTPTYGQLPLGRKSIYPRFTRAAALAAVLAVLGSQSDVQAQSDNFDSYSTKADMQAAGWFLAELAPGLATTTFPAIGAGKGMRLQANPIPSAAPAAGLWYRTNVYTDFHVSIDVVDWPGTDKNQALVLFARMTDSSGEVTPNLNPGAVQGMICNYDASQYGENPGNRRQGQFQINAIAPGFGATTIAVSEVTLIPGRSYRITFNGVGVRLTGRVYDFHDLTKPVVTLEVDDPLGFYPSGACGVLAFSRQSTAGTADATFDNYHAGVTDPNVAPAPALAHTTAGTPQVVTRNPTNRFTNFHPATDGISFTVNTFSAAEIDAAATKLFLNGLDVSASLAPLPANATAASFATAAGTLAENTVYSAQIEVQDVAGTKKSTNTFWFDTFTDGYLATAPVKTVEAEDYNYTTLIGDTFFGGQYQLEPIPVSGFDTNGLQINGFTNEVQLGYLDVIGTDGVDFDDNRTGPEALFALYRKNDSVGTIQGSIDVLEVGGPHTGEPPNYDDGGTNRANDNTRQKYAALGMREYQVVRTETGEWLNYTRVFANTNYHVYLRVGSFGASTVNLDLVTSNPTQPGQTTAPLGAFAVPNQMLHGHYRYQPLMSNGVPAVVNLAGTNTIRLTMGGTAGEDNRKLCLNYLLFVPVPPAPPTGPTVFDNFNDGNDTANAAWNHFDPIGGLGAPFPPAVYSFPGGAYRILSPAPPIPDAGPARAGSFLRDAEYSDFYVAVDVIDFDDTVSQAFGIAARIRNPGLGTTDGYLFSWEPGSGTLPGTNNGDLDISRLVAEAPIGQIETNSSGLHLERGKSYRFAFTGKGPYFVGEVYELPNSGEPLIRVYGYDPDDLYPSGQVGLIAADQGGGELNQGDATFDNFLATTAEPRLAVQLSGGNVIVSWPDIPFRLVSSPSLSAPVWTEVTTGITAAGGRKVHTTTASDTKYYRLVYP